MAKDFFDVYSRNMRDLGSPSHSRRLFEVLLDRIAAVEPAGEARRSSSTFVGGLKTLPLKITPA